MSGADLTEICQRAAKLAIRDSIAMEMENGQDSGVNEISMKYFESAMKNARRSVTQQEIAQFEAFARSMNVELNENAYKKTTATSNNDLYN